MDTNLLIFFNHLGNAIIDSFWQMGIIWLLVQFIFKSHRSITPIAASLLSFTGLVLGFLFFITNIFSTERVSLFDLFSTGAFIHSIAYLGILYAILLIVPVIKLCKGFVTLHHVIKVSRAKVPVHLKLYTQRIAAYLDIKRKVTVIASAFIKSPLTLGFLKPVILLPVAAINHLSPQQLEAIILHELAHIKNKDYLVNLVSRFIQTFMYFNPFVKSLARLQELEREKAADHWVMQFEYNAVDYSNALLAFAKTNLANSELTVKAGSAKGKMYQRISFILGNTQRSFPPVKSFVTALFFTGICFLCSPRAGVKNETVGLLPANTGFVHTAFSNEGLPTPAVYTNGDVDDNSSIINTKTSHTQTTTTTTITTMVSTATDTGKPYGQANENISPAKANNAMAIFIDNRDEHLPELLPAQEAQVQQAIDAAKQIVADAGWKQIESSLAETMTIEQKEILKQNYQTLLGKASWKSLQAQLKIKYDSINWQAANARMNAVLIAIKYNIVNELRNVQAQQHQLDSLPNKAQSVNAIINRTDSLKGKSITEL